MERTETLHNTEANLKAQQQLLIDRIEFSFSVLPVPLALFAVAAIMVADYLHLSWVWLCCVLLLSVLGAIMWTAHRRMLPPTYSKALRWRHLLLLLLVLMGCCWGGSFWLAPASTDLMQWSLLGVLFLTVTLCCMVCLQLTRLGFYGFYFPSLLLLLAYLFFGASAQFRTLGWILAFSLLVLLMVHEMMYRYLSRIFIQCLHSNALAYQDVLTGLANRRLFEDRLENAINLSLRRQRKLAVMLLDLDFFKVINDTLGHSVGDQVLQIVAQRMRQAMRLSDTVARFGGDEFVILLPEVNNVTDVVSVAEKLIALIRKPLELQDKQFILGLSIGIAFYPDHAQDARQLVNQADAAMYEAKKNGGSRWQLPAP